MYFVNLNKEKKPTRLASLGDSNMPSKRRKITEVSTIPKPSPKAKEKLLAQGGENVGPCYPA